MDSGHKGAGKPGERNRNPRTSLPFLPYPDPRNHRNNITTAASAKKMTTVKNANSAQSNEVPSAISISDQEFGRACRYVRGMDDRTFTDLLMYLALCDAFDWWLTEAADQDVAWAELFTQQDKPY